VRSNSPADRSDSRGGGARSPLFISGSAAAHEKELLRVQKELRSVVAKRADDRAREQVKFESVAALESPACKQALRSSDHPLHTYLMLA
jgi:hypothetical protein